VNNEYIKSVLLNWTTFMVVIVGVAFVYLWRKGHLLRLSNYVQETREELRKCTWPTWDELKGATFVVMISTLLLGLFTVGIDYLLVITVSWVTKI
jgi:preprotein translocase subunit SecE